MSERTSEFDRPADRPDEGSDDHSVDRAAADAVADERIAEAARRRSLRRQADEDDTWAGVLQSLGEQGATVTVELRGDRRLVGTVAMVGTDAVGVRTAGGRHVLVATTAVAAVRADPTTSAVSGDRAPRRAAPLADLLRHLAALQSPVTVRAAGNATPVTGTLRSVGADVVTLSCDGRTVVVPLANVDEVAVDELVL
ncbi:MAG: hypothetical protein KDB35_17370 [Acidimicrobiales bacterium]|nr:hypothetical protein [Acidimicrobiales bacterium]